MSIAKEDYIEPCCVLSKPGAVTPIPAGRVLAKLDEHLGKNDYDAAERHLLYWVTEAERSGDLRGELTLVNEEIGLFRKKGMQAEALRAVKRALALLEALDLDGSIIMATTYINAATAYRAFDMAKKALPLYEDAKTIYEKNLEPGDRRLGGLYNNMALTVMELNDHARAETLFHMALAVMERVEGGEAECAVTYCNLADLAAAKYGMESGETEIGACLSKARELLDTESLPRDGYYAFICEKCAPTFGYYGYFMDADIFRQRAVKIYEGT